MISNVNEPVSPHLALKKPNRKMTKPQKVYFAMLRIREDLLQIQVSECQDLKKSNDERQWIHTAIESADTIPSEIHCHLIPDGDEYAQIWDEYQEECRKVRKEKFDRLMELVTEAENEQI